jgi:hypothetical protein
MLEGIEDFPIDFAVSACYIIGYSFISSKFKIMIKRHLSEYKSIKLKGFPNII